MSATEEAAEGIVRDILEALCRRDGLSLGEEGEFTWIDADGNDTHVLVGT